MIGGIIIGTLLIAIIAIVGGLLYFDSDNPFILIMTIVLVLITGFISFELGRNADIFDCKAELVKFNVTKDLYNNSVSDKNLTGLERLEIVKMANDANSEIAEYKVYIHAWWSFAIPKEIKQEYDNVKYIGTNEGETE